MGEMPRNWPPEFAKRAKENLDLVCSGGKNDVTQTVLTLYALVVVPDEKDVFKGLIDLDRDAMSKAGWPIEGWCWTYKNQRGPTIDEAGMKALLRMLRNALAHGHLEFLSGNGAISGIKFSHGLGQNTICGTWTNNEALQVCQKVLELIEKVTPEESSPPRSSLTNTAWASPSRRPSAS